MALESRPTDAWLKKQDPQRVRDMAAVTRWWRLMLMDGGTVLEAETNLTEVGTVTQENFLSAIDSASRDGRKELAKLFPAHVKTVLGSG